MPRSSRVSLGRIVRLTDEQRRIRELDAVRPKEISPSREYDEHSGIRPT